jgi:hypothetical protein
MLGQNDPVVLVLGPLQMAVGTLEGANMLLKGVVMKHRF